MKSDPTHLVVSPPTHQGSVLGRIVAGDNRLGEILAYLVRWKSALESSIAETLAELAALRANTLAYTSAPIDREDEPLFFTRGFDLPRAEHLQAFLARRADTAHRCTETVLSGQFGILEDSRKNYKITRPEWAGQLFQGKDREGLKWWSFVRSDATQAGCGRISPLVIKLPNQLPQIYTGSDISEEELAGSPTSTPSPESEKKFVPLPIEPWADRRQETFLSLFGKLLEKTRTEERNGPSFPARVGAVDLGALRQKALEEPLTVRTNWCPTCRMYVSDNHDAAGNLSCKQHQDKFAAENEARVAKRAKTLVDYCTEFKKKNNAKLAAKGWVGYSPEKFDKEILESRGSVTEDAVRHFEKGHSRRLNKWRVR